MRNYLLIILLGCLGIWPGLLSAQPLSGGEILKTPMGVRQAGMAEAATAVSGDITLLQYNPAGVTDLTAPEIDTMVTLDLFDSRSATVILGAPVRWLGEGSLVIGALGSFGPDMEINQLDGSSESLPSQRDFVLTAGYGHRVSPALSAGVAVKALQSTLLDEYTATAVLCDAGVLYRGLPLPGLNVGAALQNVGTPIQYLDESDPAPTALRVGFGYVPVIEAEHGLKAVLDWVFPNDGDPVTQAGVEYGFQKSYFLRAGYTFGSEGKSFTLGAGVSLKGLRIDYAFAKSAVGPDVHRLGAGYVLGAIK